MEYRYPGPQLLVRTLYGETEELGKGATRVAGVFSTPVSVTRVSSALAVTSPGLPSPGSDLFARNALRLYAALSARNRERKTVARVLKARFWIIRTSVPDLRVASPPESPTQTPAHHHPIAARG